MQICNAGEDALIVYLGEEANPKTSHAVQAASTAISAALGPDLVDLVPSYASILVIYNLLRTDHLRARQKISACLETLLSTPQENSRLVTLPCWYSSESGPDLDRLAADAQLTTAQVIDLHQATEYQVYAIGFAPGFAYLGQVDERIAAPRLSTPRQKVPRGAVAIADRQTAVYPAPSPGGWNLIGLCPTAMFSPASEPIMPVTVGDRVRFEAIDKPRYLELGGKL
jgi:KipI family sensor histidine kinase inhibitor